MSAERLLFWEAVAGALIFGSLIGSFLNVCIYRVPLGLSVVTPRSRCPSCGTPIAWYDNIPVLSWFVLRGRCRACRSSISLRYPFVELLNALVWLAAVLRYGPTPLAVLVMVFGSACIVLFFTDWDHKLLPDRITLPLAVIGLVTSPWNPLLDFAPGALGAGTPLTRLGASALGAVVGYGLFFTLVLAWRVLFARDAMGGGDLKMMLGVGAFLGISGVGTTVLLASFLGTGLSIPFLLFRRWSMTRELPFGCFLAPAALFSAFYGREIVTWYLGFLVY